MQNLSLPPGFNIPELDMSPLLDYIPKLSKVDSIVITAKDSQHDRPYLPVIDSKTGNVFRFARVKAESHEPSLVCCKCRIRTRSAVKYCGIGACSKIVCEECLTQSIRGRDYCEFCHKSLSFQAACEGSNFQPCMEKCSARTSNSSRRSFEVGGTKEISRRCKYSSNGALRTRYDSFCKDHEQLMRASVFEDFSEAHEHNVETLFDITTSTTKKSFASTYSASSSTINIKELVKNCLALGIKAMSMF
mmetsp:Transcript_53263/g.61152  ORF Transcript_53263/g.61152 Transcript_53263/m.61152 type:complete len:247 (+) Transcript_53263:82-822(+)